MPPRKQTGTLLAEEHLAQRIELERKLRGWTHEGLAKRVTDAGCPIQPSAVYKIERGDPRRRITVDEAIAYAAVFDIPVGDLFVSPQVVAKSEFREAWERLRKRESMWLDAQERHREENEDYRVSVGLLRNRLGALAEADPELRGLVPDLVKRDPEIHESKRETVADAYLSLLDVLSDPKNRSDER
jgi:transcriptional regulator with XRE-family HTH domain